MNNRSASAAMALLLMVCGCATAGNVEVADGVDSIREQVTLPDSRGIPFPSDRGAAGLTEYLINGANAELSSTGASPSGPALVLDASGAGVGAQWALYRFNPGGNQQDSVSVLLDEALTTGAYIGLANYATQRWEFSGPYTGHKSLLTDSADYRSPAGNQWIAVIAPHGKSATVNALSVRTINPDNAVPTAALSASPLSGNAPLTVDFDASGSADTDGSIIEYAWDFDGNGTYEEFSETAQVRHIYQAAGIRDVRVRVTDDQFARSGAASVAVTVNLLGNDLPLADLQASATSGNAPLTVSFDASGSSDPDGTIARYDWDFDGDGVWDAYDAPAQVPQTYSAAGIHIARVRVTDNAGAQAAAELAVAVNLLGNDPPVAAVQASATSGNAPLTVNFDASASIDPDGTIIRYDWDFDGDGLWDAYDAPAQVQCIYNGGSYMARVRVTDNAGAQDTAEQAVSTNALPLAALATGTPVANPGETVFLSAAGSSDPDGSIADYEWDLDGDSVFNEAGTEANARGGATATKLMSSTPGHASVAVRVTDDSGAQATAGLTLTVRGWLRLIVDAPGSVGFYTSLAVVNGRPAISYYDQTNTDLKYAWSSSVDGSSGWSSLTVDGPGNVGGYTSLAVVSGRPAISYYDVTNNDLKYAWSSSASGGGGWSSLMVDAPGNVGGYTSLAVVNGRPAIGYYDQTNTDLKYAWSSAADGSSGWSNLAVDAPGDVGRYSSLAVVNGRPAISYYDGTNFNLKYAWSNTVDGSSGWSSTLVDAPGDVGAFTALAVVNGKPAISYYDFTNADLKYAWSSNPGGSSGWSSLTVDAPGVVGAYTSLAVVGGRPAIGYYDVTNTDLKYAWSSSADGSGGWSSTTTLDAGEYISLAAVNGRPAISYLDNTNANLKYAVLYE